MAILDYNSFKNVLNQIVFEKSKADLLQKISAEPARYIGLFRPTKPKAKLLQNLLQSHEIRFGNAFETIIERYFQIQQYLILPKNYRDTNGNNFSIDHCLKINDELLFIEQKVRDDHDSSKKRGQIENFEKKLFTIISQYPKQKITGIFYFIDPELTKNSKFYTNELNKIGKDYKVELHLFYGKQLFDYLNLPEIWDEILRYLELWKKELPDLPEINFDINAQHTFEEIKNLKPIVFRKLLKNDVIFREILLTLFPECKTLQLLKLDFEKREQEIYKTLAKVINKKLETINKKF